MLVCIYKNIYLSSHVHMALQSPLCLADSMTEREQLSQGCVRGLGSITAFFFLFFLPYELDKSIYQTTLQPGNTWKLLLRL